MQVMLRALNRRDTNRNDRDKLDYSTYGSTYGGVRANREERPKTMTSDVSTVQYFTDVGKDSVSPNHALNNNA